MIFNIVAEGHENAGTSLRKEIIGQIEAGNFIEALSRFKDSEFLGNGQGFLLKGTCRRIYAFKDVPVSHNQITELAYKLWTNCGKPEGFCSYYNMPYDKYFWSEAELILKTREM